MHFIVIKKIPSIFPFLELRYIRTFQCNYWPRKKQTGKKANILPAPCLQPFFWRGRVFIRLHSKPSQAFTPANDHLSCGFPKFFGATSKVLHRYVLLSNSASFLHWRCLVCFLHSNQQYSIILQTQCTFLFSPVFVQKTKRVWAMGTMSGK